MAAETRGDFGDKRRNKRAAEAAETWSESCDASFPAMFSSAELKGFCRLLGHDDFQFTDRNFGGAWLRAISGSEPIPATAATVVITC